MGSLPGLLEGRQWAQLVKALDAELPAAGGDRRQLLLNRAFCLQQLGLLRKALKVGGRKCRAMCAPPGPAAAAVMRVKRSDAGGSAGSPGNGARRPAASRRCLPPLGLSMWVALPPLHASQPLQDYETVLDDEPAHAGTLLLKAKVLVALRQGEVRPGWIRHCPTAAAAA